jgi:hypothetical protein
MQATPIEYKGHRITVRKGSREALGRYGMMRIYYAWIGKVDGETQFFGWVNDRATKTYAIQYCKDHIDKTFFGLGR